MRFFRLLLGLIVLALVTLGVAYYIAGRAAGPAIVITQPSVIGWTGTLDVTVDTPRGQLDSLTVVLEQHGRTIPVLSLDTASRQSLRLDGPDRVRIARPIGKQDLSQLEAGQAVVLLVNGSRRVRFASLWVLITLLPFAFFTWGNTSRYLYLPAIGFSMLLAEAVLAVDRLAAARLPVRWRRVVVGTLFLAVVVRFVVFTTKSVDDFVNRTFVYREYIQAFRAAHPRLPAGALVRVPIPRDARLQQIYLEPLVQWEYADPTIHLQIVPES